MNGQRDECNIHCIRSSKQPAIRSFIATSHLFVMILWHGDDDEVVGCFSQSYYLPPPPIYHSFLIKGVLRGSSTILICSFKILSGFFAQFCFESFPPLLFALSRGGIVILANVKKKLFPIKKLKSRSNIEFLCVWLFSNPQWNLSGRMIFCLYGKKRGKEGDVCAISNFADSFIAYIEWQSKMRRRRRRRPSKVQ